MPIRRLALVLALLAASFVPALPAASAVDACVGIVCVIDQPVIDAVPGDHHACFLLADGDVVCSGASERGQAAGRREGDAVAIAAGVAHTCALLRSGDVDCWGAPAETAADRLGGDAIAIDAAGFQTCALLRSGDVDCWGARGSEPSGEPLPDWTRGHAVAVDVTKYYACALFDDTSVDCWGVEDGRFGQVYGWPAGGVVALGGGDQHTCVVLVGGNVRCWGTSAGVVPYDGGDAVAVDGGYDSTCILTTGADVRCVGAPTVEDGACLADWLATRPLRCENLEARRDPRSRAGGDVRAMTIYPGASGACYVLHDGSAECTGVVPTVEPEPAGENRASAPARGVTLQETTPTAPAVHVEHDPRIVVPVRLCPISGTCVGHVVVDPGTGRLVVDHPPTVLGPPVSAHARFAGASVGLDTATGATGVAGGASAGACIESRCLGLP